MTVVDKQLDALVEITGQTKMAANQINSELKDQNQMIQGTTQKMDRVDGRVVQATSKVNEVAKSKSNLIAWVVSVLLIIAIVVVWIVGA